MLCQNFNQDSWMAKIKFANPHRKCINGCVSLKRKQNVKYSSV